MPFGRAEVVATVRALVPSADFTAPTWGQVVLPGAQIEINVPDEPQLGGVVLHIRGGDQTAADEFVAQLLRRLNVRAFDSDSETGLFSAL